MDPNIVLQDIRDALEAFHANGDQFNRRWDHEDSLVEAIEALDGWLSQGGYLPADWQGRKPIMGVFEV